MHYQTLAAPATAELTIKKSRFIGHASPVCTADEALLFCKQIAQKHPGANHNVWAFSLRQGRLQRFNDDGEPKGTAGMPTLDVLTKQEIVDAAVVVTRYFGGILLGAGGLVRAYSQAAKAAVNAAGIATMAMCALVQLRFDYTLYGRMGAVISAAGGTVLAADFGPQVTLEVRARIEHAPQLIAAVTDACNGRCTCEIVREEFAAVM